MAEIIKTDLNKLFSEADKKFGKGALTFADVVPEVQVIASTGSFLLDIALECGGNPEGRILEYYGGPSGGKTSLSLLSAVEVQKMGKTAAFLDIEGTFNKNWAKKLGLDLSKLLYWQPNAGDSGDTAFEVMDLMINMGVSFIVLDSVSALVTAAEIKGEYGDAHMGQLARLMSGGLKKINNSIAKKPCTIVFINQIRKEIAIFGAYDTTSGGKALEFYSSIRLNVKRKEVIGTENDPDGFKTEIRIVKNKVGKPFKKITTNLYLGKKTIKNGYCGIDKIEEILDTAINLKILENRGKGWIYYKGNQVDQGKENVYKTISENPEMFEEITKEVIKQLAEQLDMPVEGSFDHLVSQNIKAREPREKIATTVNEANLKTAIDAETKEISSPQ